MQFVGMHWQRIYARNP